MKDTCLKLLENTDPDAEKCTKWIFGYRIRSGKKIKEIVLIKEESKQANIAISAITGLRSGQPIDPMWVLVDQEFFLKQSYYADLDRMAHIYTNVYRMNIMDMAYSKINDDGRAHTSTPFTCNFDCYLGFGTFKEDSDAYGGHVWTRYIGRVLMELTNMGDAKRILRQQIICMNCYITNRIASPFRTGNGWRIRSPMMRQILGWIEMRMTVMRQSCCLSIHCTAKGL